MLLREKTLRQFSLSRLSDSQPLPSQPSSPPSLFSYRSTVLFYCNTEFSTVSTVLRSTVQYRARRGKQRSLPCHTSFHNIVAGFGVKAEHIVERTRKIACYNLQRGG